MEVNIYNVIWADDECATLKQDELIRKVFNEKRIEVLEYVPTSTALRNALETYKDEVDAVVVDGNFSKEDVDYLESDDISGLIHTVSFLELYNTKRDIPFFLYTARKILLQDICKNRELDYFTTTKRLIQKGDIELLAEKIVSTVDHIHSIEFMVKKKYIFLVSYLTIVPLMLLKFCEFINQCLVNDKLLVSVSSWRFVFMRTNTFHQEACHFEMGISE